LRLGAAAGVAGVLLGGQPVEPTLPVVAAANVSGGTFASGQLTFWSDASGTLSGVPGGYDPVSNTIAIGSFNTAKSGSATVGGGENNTATGLGATVAGGLQNTSNAPGAFVGGGGTDGTMFSGNVATGNASAIGGGLANVASGSYATVGGGHGNTAGAFGATVAGGYNNTASLSGATVCGGSLNSATGFGATVGGGDSNTAGGSFAIIDGGSNNFANGGYGTVGGGSNNSADGPFSTLGGGFGNVASFYFATVGGGTGNHADASGATIGGGAYNHAAGLGATVAGGISGAATGEGATVGGGEANLATAGFATVGGGLSNNAAGATSTVGGGASNNASGLWATVGGGVGNSVSGAATAVGGGFFNKATASGATVPGGQGNSAGGGFSFAAGSYATVLSGHHGSILLSDDSFVASGLLFQSAGPDEFAVRAAGGVRLVTGIDSSGNATQQLTVSSSGFLGVSTSGASTPEYAVDLRTPGKSSAQLHISPSDTDSGGYLTAANAGNLFMSAGAAWNGSAWVAKNSTSYQYGGGVAGVRFFFDTGLTVGATYTPTTRMFIGPTGNVGIGMSTQPGHLLQLGLDDAAKPSTNTWTIASDGRLKDPESIEPFTEGLDFIARLPQPVWFRYRRESGLPSDRRVAGWIAQDVAPVAPFMVRRTKQKLAESDSEETETLSLNTNELSYAVVNSIKELRTENQKLGSEIAELKRMIQRQAGNGST
jgi:hypothetical protein